MRKAITLLLGSSILLTSGAALAQYPTGGQAGGQYGGTYQPSYQRPSHVDNVGATDGQFVFGVERVTGVFSDHLKQEPEGGPTNTTNLTSIGLFGNTANVAAVGTGAVLSSVHSLPRLALDYFVVEGVSLGGSFVYWRMSGDTEVEDGDSTDLATLSSVMFQPRVGYSFVLDDTFAIWPRATFTYGNSKSDSDALTITLTSLDIGLDVPVVISPIENFAILVGPFVDFGVGGTVKTETSAGSGETDAKLTTFGLSVGIAGYY